MAIAYQREKRVSFAYTLVTASWNDTSTSTSTKRMKKKNKKEKCVHVDGASHSTADVWPHNYTCSVHPIVDSLHVELEVPLVAQYRVVQYIWMQCHHIAPHTGPVLPPRPTHIVPPFLSNRYSASGEYSYSPAVKDVVGLSTSSRRRLAAVVRSAMTLHPFSRRLEPVTRPVLSFLQRTSTRELSRRQNNIIALVPKLMEIIILLCHCLEYAAQMYGKAIARHRHGSIHSTTTTTTTSTTIKHSKADCKMDEDYLLQSSTILYMDRQSVKTSDLTERCAWWISRLRGCKNSRPHRLFTKVKELLLQPGPMCDVKAVYLRYIAHHFFPQFPSICQNIYHSVCNNGNDDDTSIALDTDVCSNSNNNNYNNNNNNNSNETIVVNEGGFLNHKEKKVKVDDRGLGSEPAGPIEDEREDDWRVWRYG